MFGICKQKKSWSRMVESCTRQTDRQSRAIYTTGRKQLYLNPTLSHLLAIEKSDNNKSNVLNC